MEVAKLTSEQKSGSATLNLFAAVGIDYYLAERFAVSARLRFGVRATGTDPDTDDDDSATTKTSSRRVGLRLGVSTYF